MVSIVTGCIGISVALVIILLMRNDRLHVAHGLSWFVVALGFALLGFAPGIIDTVAQKLGIAYPPILAMTLGIALLVVKILAMDMERSRIEIRNQRLIQKVAMLEAEIKRLTREDVSANAGQDTD
jgi:hypothetical protein